MTRPLAPSATTSAALLAVFGALPLWAAAVAQPADAAADVAAADPLTPPLVARLTGTAAVPPGDVDGEGAFRATLNDTHDQFCYELTVDRIDQATRAAVHEGAAGQTGAAVIALQPPANGTAKGCTTVTAALAIKLTQHPERYYVSVANAGHAQGAVWGQLGR